MNADTTVKSLVISLIIALAITGLVSLIKWWYG